MGTFPKIGFLPAIIAEDYPVVRNAVKHILTANFMFPLILETDNKKALLQLVKMHPASLLVLDMYLLDGSTLHILETVRNMQPAMKIVYFTVYSEELFSNKAMKRGADGYLNKKADEVEIIEAVSTVLSGKKYLSQEMQYKTIFESAAMNGDRNPFSRLSARELEVCVLLLSCSSIEDVAIKANIQYGTVCTHRNNIFKKLNIFSFNEFVLLADTWKVHNA